MKYVTSAMALTFAAGFWAGPVLAEPEICKVVLTSAEAGRLEVRKTILPADAERVVHVAASIGSTWSPAKSGGDLNVRIAFSADDQDKGIGHVIAVEIDFPHAKGVRADQFTAQLNVDGRAPVFLDGAAEIMGSDTFGFVLDGERVADRAMGHALGQGARANVVIFEADRVLQPEMFEGTKMSLTVLGQPKAVISEQIDTRATAARDTLFAEAKPLIVARDPKVCKPLQYESGVLVEDRPDE